MGAAQSHPSGDLAASINGFGHSLFNQVAAQVRSVGAAIGLRERHAAAGSRVPTLAMRLAARPSHPNGHLQGKAGQGGGLFLSPYGVAQALGMLLNGVAPGGDSFRQLQVSSRAPAGGFRACRV